MRLLQFRPEDRMTLDAARFHPWLHTQATAAGLSRDRPARGMLEAVNRDASMSIVAPLDAMAVDEPTDDASMTSQSIAVPGRFPSGSQATRMTRRSQVLIERQESGVGLPDASWQIVDREVDNANSAVMAASGRGAKRERLRSIPEDHNAGAPLQDASTYARNRRRVVESSAVVKSRGRGARKASRGRTAVRGRITKEEYDPDMEEGEDDDDSIHSPRRSSRIAGNPKIIRKA